MIQTHYTSYYDCVEYVEKKLRKDYGGGTNQWTWFEDLSWNYRIDKDRRLMRSFIYVRNIDVVTGWIGARIWNMVLRIIT